MKIYGTSNPQVVFLIENPSSEEFEIFKTLFNMRGLNENNCRFIVYEDELINMDVYSLFEEELKILKPLLLVIVGGEEFIHFLINEGLVHEDTSFRSIDLDHGSLYTAPECKVMPYIHPRIIMDSKNLGFRMSFKEDINRIITYCTDKLSGKDEIHCFEDETVICLDYKQFDEFCKDQIDNAELVAYDIETNAREKTSEEYNVVGFSLASNSKKGCYVVLNSLDYNMSEQDRKIVEARLRKILSTKQIMVYNYSHEELATLSWLGIEMQNVEDLLIIVKLLMGNATEYAGNGGLKIQCEMNLGIKDWSQDLDIYMEYFPSILKEDIRAKMIILLKKYYDSEDINGLLELIDEESLNDENYSGDVTSYGVVPYKLIGKYGGIDASILFDLLDYYKKKMKEFNEELGINLDEGYQHWKKHHIAGYTLEKNGAYFNTEKADAVEKWCQEGMNETLLNMIKSPLSKEYIKSKIYPDFLLYLMKNHLTEILNNYATPKRMFKSSVNVILEESIRDNPLREDFIRMSMIPNKSGQYKLELGHIETLSKKYMKNLTEVYNEWYNNFLNDFNSKSHEVEDMKKFINPTATGAPWKDFLSGILITNEMRYAMIYRLLNEYIESPNFSIEYYKGVDLKLIELLMKLKNTEEMPSTRKFELFAKFLSSHVKDLRSNYLRRKINEALNFKITSMDDDNMIYFYELYKLCGTDIEKPESWSDNFTFLYNLRKYKKFSKIISTYINGKVGRKNVWYVDKESYSDRGDYFTKRKFRYWDKDNHNISNMVPMLQSSFLVDFADTGRWTAGMHTIPSADTTKGIYTSRFKGGMIAMPDCSQAEIRVLAAVSQDKNLMEAFQKEGTDIHKYVASKIYHNGDLDAVTKNERKVAKGAVFGILYGESVDSFAESFTHGDKEEAQKIFDFFFTAFPKIRDYVEDSHNQFNRNEKISLGLTNRFIDLHPIVLENYGDTNKALRQSQNFIIQGTTCDVAGLILYKVCEFVKKNNLKSKPFCFIHDSIEIDIHPDELFLMLDALKPLFNEFPMKEFGIPMASDIVFSTNMGAEIDSHILKHDEEYNDVEIKLEGFEDDIQEVLKSWNDVYDTVELISREDGEEKYVPIEGLFQKKVVISKLMGTYRKEISCIYHVIRKK